MEASVTKQSHVRKMGELKKTKVFFFLTLECTGCLLLEIHASPNQVAFNLSIWAVSKSSLLFYRCGLGYINA